jgi:dihydrofolate reductase
MNMRKVIFLVHMSLDGFTAGPNGEMDWITVDDEIFLDAIELQNTADVALFGRVNYEGFASYWPTVAANPASSPSDLDHARWLDASTKIVFSKTLKKVNWQNTRIVSDDIAGEMTRLKTQPGKNLILFGGATIASAFMKLGLIDEYRINVNPVVLGGGKSLFGDLKKDLKLKLIHARTFSSGVVSLAYQPDPSSWE